MITNLLFASALLQGNALLDDLQHRAVSFFWEQSSPANGFTKDRATSYVPIILGLSFR